MKIEIISVFLAGLVSFISPCVISIIPLYLAYFSKNDKNRIERVIKTILFCFGLLSVYFIISLFINGIGAIINKYSVYLSLIAAIILVFMGLVQLDILEIKIFKKTKDFNSDRMGSLNYLKTFIMGFLFGLSWTPCISPTLTAIITLSIASTSLLSSFYILIYGLGFTLPFIILSLLSDKFINALSKNQDNYKFFIKAMAVLLIILGLKMFFDSANQLSRNTVIAPIISSKKQMSSNENKIENKAKIHFLEDFSISDQHDNILSNDSFKDKYLMINFMTSWCTYCKAQRPLLEELATKYQDDLNVVIVMSDVANADGTNIKEYAKDFKLPVLDDKGGDLFGFFGVRAFPYAYFIGPKGEIIGSIPGAVSRVKELESSFESVKDIYVKEIKDSVN